MAYEVHLKEFDGPLDLLLHLIEQAKVDIKDIFISEITNQYLSLMEELDELDMDTASEFLTMAATLISNRAPCCPNRQRKRRKKRIRRRRWYAS